MLEMAAKVDAALARSRLAQERIQAAVREAVREANEAAAKVREDWAKAPSSRASLSNRSRSEPGGLTRGDRPRGANPARRWAFGDEVKGKTDVFDRFMGSLSAIKLAREGVEGTERVENAEGSDDAEFPHPPRRARTRPSTISSTRRTRRRRRRTGTTNAPPREAAPRRPPAPSAPSLATPSTGPTRGRKTSRDRDWARSACV